MPAGVIVVFAMKFFEKGILRPGDTEGLELSYGNDRAIVDLLR
ncbi:MAG: hypothetical protein JSW70_06125 [Syntrophobacterales bacterium]|nr:MAG: hypothetical protein JSW70_06125 [Syntrophobacterales bacterium]